MTTNIAFLDTLVTREPDGKLHTSVYRKPTHTDQYLAYDSHHPQSVKRGIVKCLHDRAKRIITKENSRIQVHRSAAIHQRSGLRVRQHTKISADQTKRSRSQTSQMAQSTRYHALRIPRFQNMLTEPDTSSCGTQ